MTDDKTVWDLRIHEMLTIDDPFIGQIVVLRVPGGWLYNVTGYLPVYVPFTAEGKLAEMITVGKRYEKRIIKRIIEIILMYYNISEVRLYDKTRQPAIVKARYQVIYFVSKYISKMTLENRGKIFDLDHATVLHALKTVNNEIETNPEYRLHIVELDGIIKLAIIDLDKTHKS